MFNPNSELPPQQGPVPQTSNLKNNIKQIVQKTKEKAAQAPQSISAACTHLDTGNPGWWLFGFFLPILGFTVYLCWRKYRPLTAHKTIVGSVIGLIVQTFIAGFIGTIVILVWWELLKFASVWGGH